MGGWNACLSQVSLFSIVSICVECISISVTELQWRTEGGLGGSTPLPKILKALQNRAKLNPIVKTVKNCCI